MNWQYTKSEVMALSAITYQAMTTTLSDFGWYHDTEELSNPYTEIWKKANPRAALLVFQPNATYMDLTARQAESISVFAKAEGLSRFEAIALLTGITPWKSAEIRDRILVAQREAPNGGTSNQSPL